MRRTGIFEVDTKGMRIIALQRGLPALMLELFQNALDENVTLVDIGISAVRPGLYEITVSDDSPEGFRDLVEAYTLYAPSYKRGDPEKRGQFNIGEKFVIAACESCEITSTTGTVQFNDEGRHNRRLKRESGTVFRGLIRTNQEQVARALDTLRNVIVPRQVVARVNGVEVAHREPIVTVSATLPTLIPAINEEGVMRPTRRQTSVSLYEPPAGEPAMLYEMGLPIVVTGDAFDIDVAQRVPLNQDRDNVTPSYLAAVRAVALNAAVENGELEGEHVSETWVREAAGHKDAAPEAVRKVMDLRFGTRRVGYDPSDVEANKRAVENGYTLVYSANLSRDERVNVRAAGALTPAGQKFPSTEWGYSDSPDAEPEKVIPESAWSPGMLRIASHARFLACELLGVSDLPVRLVNEPIRRADALASYVGGRLYFNAGRLGFKWFDKAISDPAVSEIIIHEFAHHYSEDHLSRKYHDALSDLGARMVKLALDQPQAFA